MKCPTCSEDCVIPAEKVLDELFQMYMACSTCPDDPGFNKSAPFTEDIDLDTGCCEKCGKRHLDHVIGNVLTILRKKGQFSGAALREIGTPLISFGYQIPYPPRLGKNSLVLIMDSITKDMAEELVTSVPEIKGVIKRTGTPSKSVGILDTESKPHTYELLAGCDTRCDIISSLFGELCIYKSQSMIHVEFNNTKIRKIEELYLGGKLDNSVIVDALCGPGTLGLLCALGGARKVIMNDAWLPAVRNTIMNLKANSDVLGLKIELENTNYSKMIGEEPVLMAKASGTAEVLVYHGDIRYLEKEVRESDICLIDTFPSVNPSEYVTICTKFSKNVIVI